MTEHLPQTNPEVTPPLPEANKPTGEQQMAPLRPETQPDDQLEAIRQTIEDASKHSHVETGALTNEAPSQPKPTYANKELKAIALRRTLKHLQHDLPAGQRMLSKFIHQPAVRRVSAATGQTIARPSGLLGGGVCALLGTLIYLYLAKHIGFSYNYLLFLLFFGGGFIVGLLVELGAHALASFRAKRS